MQNEVLAILKVQYPKGGENKGTFNRTVPWPVGGSITLIPHFIERFTLTFVSKEPPIETSREEIISPTENPSLPAVYRKGPGEYTGGRSIRQHPRLLYPS